MHARTFPVLNEAACKILWFSHFHVYSVFHHLPLFPSFSLLGIFMFVVHPHMYLHHPIPPTNSTNSTYSTNSTNQQCTPPTPCLVLDIHVRIANIFLVFVYSHLASPTISSTGFLVCLIPQRPRASFLPRYFTTNSCIG